ncbi:MAG TPA: helix-turn-helix domain-containing protein, partial [Dokdonella sp.]|nr:helix-turn-helix domain-containing protein [Dokdonella sp.]
HENAVIVPASILRIRSRFADDRMHASIERVLDDLLALVGAGADATCRRALAAMRAGLRAGGARQHRAAVEAGVSRRTLQRRLAERGIDYRRLLDAMRADAAIDGLCAADEPFIALAHAIGFDEQATFSRAVRRWTGRTPREIRARFGDAFRARPQQPASPALAQSEPAQLELAQSDKYTARARC